MDRRLGDVLLKDGEGGASSATFHFQGTGLVFPVGYA